MNAENRYDDRVDIVNERAEHIASRQQLAGHWLLLTAYA